jgi:two-component system, OmpR family, phosphate regulon sensor histidine kinase PhoR
VTELASPRQRATALLRQLLDACPTGMLALDEGGTIITSNAAAAAALGRRQSHLVGKPLAAIIALPERRAFRHAIAHADLRPVEVEVKILGSTEPTSLSIQRLPRIQPATIAVTVGQQQQQQQQQQHEVARQAFLLRLPFGVVAVRRDLHVVFANDIARTLLGRETVGAGRVVSIAAVGPDLHTLVERAAASRVPLRPHQVELPGGRFLRVSSSPAHDDVPTVLFLEDVTRQVQQDRVMRDFVRNAAHQLRTPLTGIVSAIDVLQSGAKEVPEHRDRFLAHIETHAARLARLARGLLVLARAQSGEQPPRLDLVDLKPVLDELAASAEPRDGVDVVSTCPSGLAVLAEPDLLIEALAAVVENAVSHTHHGTIWLGASESDGHVTVDVVDQGGGILPEHRERVLEPFYRSVSSGEGFGLGLAIAAQAVQAMSGRLTIDDVAGGTKFAVVLPSARVMG